MKFSLQVVTSGLTLAFVTLPEATSQMPLPQVWAFLFFILLVTIGVMTLVSQIRNFKLPESSQLCSLCF